MASSPTTLPPPPGSDQPQASAPPGPDTAGSPAQPNPAMQAGTQMVISIVNNLRSIAKAYPSTAPKVQEMNLLLREVMAGMMAQQHPGEPSAPPVG